jgi:hypothetical protein
MRPSVTDSCQPIVDVKDGKYDYAEKFLGLYLDALDEELVELQTYISTHKLAGIEELEGEAQSAEAQNAVGRREYTVRRLFFLSLYLNLTLPTTHE